jgi:hypothetical protein
MTWFSVLQSISILIAIWVAIAGLGLWRLEFLTKRKIELVEDWLASAYAFRDAIRYIRNPFSRGGEGSTRPRTEAEANDSPTVTEAKNRGYVFFERAEREQQAINDFFKIKYRVMARCGKHTEELYQKAAQIQNELNWAANIMARHWRETATGEAGYQGVQREEVNEASRIIWWHGEKMEVFGKRVDALIEEIEVEVKRVTEQKYGLAELLNMPFGRRVK